MRALALLLALVPGLALAAGPTISGGSGSVGTGPRILGENSFALECLLSSNPNCASATGSTTITTTRASPVPCEGGGTWTTVGNNVACVGPRGLESWPQATNYWLQSSVFTAQTQVGTPSPVLQPDGSYLVTDNDAAAFEGFRSNIASASPLAVGQVGTVSCLVRAGTSSTARFGPTGIDTCLATGISSSEFQRISCTATATAANSAGFFYITGAAADTGTMYVRSCQLELAPTSGRRCDAGASATTCQADVHEASAAGLPTAAARVEMLFTPGITGVVQTLFDTRSDAGTNGVYFSIGVGGDFVFGVADGSGTQDFSTGAITGVSAGVPRHLSIEWDNTGTYRIRSGGALVYTSAPGLRRPAAHTRLRIGVNRSGANHARGSIQLLSWSAP